MFSSKSGRTGYRFLEIFVLGGVVALYNDPSFVALLPPLVVGVLAALLKGIREVKHG